MLLVVKACGIKTQQSQCVPPLLTASPSLRTLLPSSPPPPLFIVVPPGQFAKYEKEYGVDVFEMSAESLKPGDRVVIVDDLLATGGSLKAAKRLVTDSLADPLCCLVVVELGDLDGGESVGIPCYSVLRT